jgi:MoxR-like ATPase
MTLIPRFPIYPVENYGSAYKLAPPGGGSVSLWVVSPWTPGSRSPRIYFTQYPVDTKPTQLTKKNALRAAYISRSAKGFLGCYDSVGGQVLDWERDAAMAWYFGSVRSLGLNGSKDEPCVTPGIEGPVDTTTWEWLVQRVNGAGHAGVVPTLSSATVKRRLFSQLIGVKGIQYPKSSEMDRPLIDNYKPLATVAGAPWWQHARSHPEQLEVLRDSDSDSGSGYHSQDAMDVAAKPDAPVVTIETGPVEPLPSPGDSDFNPDAMTHRDLVDLARKGHGAQQLIDSANQHRDREATLRAEAEDEADDAEKARDAAIAERDAAIERAKALVPVKTDVKVGDGTVEIDGVTLPKFDGGHGPAPIEGYDLSAWQAVVEVGDFTATASAPQVAASIMAGDSVRLVGPPSVGKTSGIREVCAHTGAKFFLIPCGEGATDLSLIAERVIGNGGEFVWRDGHVTQAVRWAIANPETVVVAVLDEVDHLVPEVQSLMHSVLEGDTLVVSPEETLVVPSNIRFVATANTSGLGDITGRHASAKVSDTAFTSRWNATYTVAYLPEKAEARLLVNAGAPVEQAEQAVRCAKMTRNEAGEVTQPIVLRQLLAWARACGRGEDPKSAWAWRVMTSTPEHDRHALRELTRTCFNW